MHRKKAYCKKLENLRNCLIVQQLLLPDTLINYFSTSVSFDLELRVTKEKLKHNLLNSLYSQASIQSSKKQDWNEAIF